MRNSLILKGEYFCGVEVLSATEINNLLRLCTYVGNGDSTYYGVFLSIPQLEAKP